MAYIIRQSDGLRSITVPDGMIDNHGTPLQIIGTNVPDYGGVIFQNMVRMTENFASVNPPGSNIIVGGGPLDGQLWYEPTNKQLSFYNGSDWNVLADLLTVTDPLFTVGNAFRFKNPLALILSNDVSGVATITGDDFIALDPNLPSQLTNAVVMSVTVDNVHASKISGHLTADDAIALKTPRSIGISGPVRGTATFDGSQNIIINTVGNVDTKVTLTGDVTGTGSIINFSDVTINSTVDFTTHNHNNLYYTQGQTDLQIANMVSDLDMPQYVKLATDQEITGKKKFTNVLEVSGATSKMSILDMVDDGFAIHRTTDNPHISLYTDLDKVGRWESSTSKPLLVKIGDGTEVFSVSNDSEVTATRFNTDSDETLKDSPEKLSISDDVFDLDLMTWVWSEVERNGPKRGKVDSGVIAQQVARISGLEHCVTTDDDGIMSVDYGKLAVHLILAMKERFK